ncbi:hypothetical protein FB45DRAFT_928610 [Roridomyces roridus]|uniref:Uncharacterized protein n=1 Tax=Roridomyces roridus TaxID=1738132 RepID=A0AAD7BHT9_9AGAR|nr:hypothetical protein FB45DRAFT_928610 [Roridomyces roridus]
MEHSKPPLDETLYDQATDEDLSFIRSQIGIQDPQELKKHILAVQKKAYTVGRPTNLKTSFFDSGIATRTPLHSFFRLHKDKDSNSTSLSARSGSWSRTTRRHIPRSWLLFRHGHKKSCQRWISSTKSNRSRSPSRCIYKLADSAGN